MRVLLKLSPMEGDTLQVGSGIVVRPPCAGDITSIDVDRLVGDRDLVTCQNKIAVCMDGMWGPMKVFHG